MELAAGPPRGKFYRVGPTPPSNGRQYDGESSSSDSSSSPPRKRSWKKLHRRKTQLVLGKHNYLGPTESLKETVEGNPKSLLESTCSRISISKTPPDRESKANDSYVPRLSNPTEVKKEFKRRFVDNTGLVILLRNDQPQNPNTSRSVDHREIAKGSANGYRNGSDLFSSSFCKKAAINNCNVPTQTIFAPQCVTVTRLPLQNVSDWRTNAESVQEQKLANTNQTNRINDERPAKNDTRTPRNGYTRCQPLRRNKAINGHPPAQSFQSGNNGNLRADLDNSDAQPDAVRPMLPSDSGEGHTLLDAQSDSSRALKNYGLLRKLIDHLSSEVSRPLPEIDSLHIAHFGSENVESYCKLSFSKPFHLKDLLHARNCDIVAEGVTLRKKCDNLRQAIPDIDEDTLDFVLGSTCREFILDNQCSNKTTCLKRHSVKLESIMAAQNGNSVFKMFLKWFDANSKQLNFRVLKSLLSLLRAEFCNADDLRTLLLWISRFIPRIKKDFQHPLALSVLKDMSTLLNIPYHESARLVLVFAVTHSTEPAKILDLFSALGASEMNSAHLFSLVSTVWHLNSSVVFPGNFIFPVVMECVREMPESFSVVRDKIVLQMMNLPRREIIKNFAKVEFFFMKFFPLNSKTAFYFRGVQILGDNPESVERIAWTDAYRGLKVSMDPINPKWDCWDVDVNRRNGFHAVVGKSKCEYLTDPLETARSEKLVITELEDDVETDEIALWTRLNTLPETDRAVQVLDTTDGSERYEKLVKTVILLGTFYNKNLLDYTLGSLYNMFADMDSELQPAVTWILRRLPLYSSYFSGPKLVRKSFISTVNALVVKFYKQRKFENALELIRTMQTNGENPFLYSPENVDHSLFEIICSHVHLECFMVKDSILILLHSKCMESGSASDPDSPFVKHFHLLEMLVFKLLKHCLAARQSLYAVNVFRGVMKAQKSLTFPLNIHPYYEPVLCSTFSANPRASKFLCHEAANLYVLVDQLCGNATKFHPMTYRSLLVALHDANVSEDVVRRTLLCCIRANAYPMFRSDALSLSCRMTTVEMYLYVRHFLQFFLSQPQFKSVSSHSLPVRLTSDDEPVSSPYSVANSISVVSTELPDSISRLQKAFELLAGVGFSELEAEVKSDSEFVLPEAKVNFLFNIVQN